MNESIVEFLKLWSLCDSALACRGDDCPPVPAQCWETAHLVDDIRAAHHADTARESHHCESCFDCGKARLLLDQLSREMEAQGVTLPSGALPLDTG